MGNHETAKVMEQIKQATCVGADDGNGGYNVRDTEIICETTGDCELDKVFIETMCCRTSSFSVRRCMSSHTEDGVCDP